MENVDKPESLPRWLHTFKRAIIKAWEANLCPNPGLRFQTKSKNSLGGEGKEQSLCALTYNPREGFQVQIWWPYFEDMKPMNFNFPFNIGSLPASQLCGWARRRLAP